MEQTRRFPVHEGFDIPTVERASWYWDRRRNQGFGFWRDANTGKRIGPIPLTTGGHPAFTPEVEPPDA